ncbi:MAG: 4Fe-4S binding protein [Bacteroidales bacterium]|nr:4Fe-4S binding protein [Bacteroidales bacterium]
MMKAVQKNSLPIAVFVFVSFILGMMELMMDTPMLIFDRFVPGLGWLQIVILATYGAILTSKMQDASQSAIWRRRSWLLFSIVFFSQFALGILADERFLMTGKLHLPVPFMIVAGPVYRAQLTIMPILLLSSIILSGPAWCSHYCYFGAWDDAIRIKALGFRLKDKDKDKLKVKSKKGGGSVREPLRNKWVWKWSFLILVVLFAWLFRMLSFSGLETLIPALAFSTIGVGIMVFISRKRNKMVHCVSFCPIGTIVNFGKFISPFRMKIAPSCTNCMRCIPTCQYDALNAEDIKAGKPGLTCTLCGDCVTSCEVSAIQYKFFNLSPKAARNLYLFITISLHVLCMGLARL